MIDNIKSLCVRYN